MTEKTVHNQSVSSKTSPHFRISRGSYTEFVEENFKVSPKSVDSGITRE